MKAIFSFLVPLLTLLNFYCSFLHADDYLTAVTENDPSTIVEGVSIFNGTYYMQDAYYTVEGLEPISHTTTYLGSLGGIRDKFYLFARFDALMNTILLHEPSGTPVVYVRNDKKLTGIGKQFFDEKKEISLFAHTHIEKTRGVSNTSSGHISAKTHLKNQKIIFHKDRDSEGKSFTLYAADGTQRRFGGLTGQKPTKFWGGAKGYTSYEYFLISETLPNGHEIHYCWNDNNELTQIYTCGPGKRKSFASLSFSQNSISGSDGRTFSIKSGQIDSPDYPPLYISFSKHAQSGKTLLESISLAPDRGIKVQYESGADYRVKAVLAPLDGRGNYTPSHTFQYAPEKKQTVVVDAMGNYAAYFWNDQFRLTRIEKFTGKDCLHHVEQFVWDNTLLRCKAFLDEGRAPLFARTFAYDDCGNIIEEIFYGNLSGKGASLLIQPNGLPHENGVERAIRRSTYDNRNLLLRQEEASGLITEYAYHHQYHLPLAKYVSSKDGIHLRTFYEYDEDLILRREITDDGFSKGISDLNGVTVRTIKEIYPRQASPYAGLPDTIEEKFWNGQKEVLLKKTRFHYTTGGKVSQREVFDAEGKFLYSLFFSYDDKGRLLQETNPLGQTAYYRYDEFGNKVFSQDFGSRLQVHFSYDTRNRMVSKEERGDDGICRLFSYTYDLKDRLLSETDYLGNTTQYAYDAFGGRIETLYPAQLLSEAQVASACIREVYNSAGLALSTTDAMGFTTKTLYNAYGKPIWIGYPDGAEEHNIYNLDGTLQIHVDPLKVETVYCYDSLGHILEKIIRSPQGEVLSREAFSYKGNLLVSKTDAEGCTTLYQYDGAGRKVAETVEGETTRYTYDSLGRLSTVIQEDLISTTEYDLMGQIVEEKKLSSRGEILRQTFYEYDTAHNLAATRYFVEGKEVKEVFAYDSLKRLIRKTDPLGFSETIVYTETTNSLGQKVSQKIHTDALGLQTIETKNALHQVVSIEKKKAVTLISTTLVYDLNQRKASQADTIYSPGRRTIHTEWLYDPRGRLECQVEARGEPEAKETYYVYNVRGERIQTVKPNGTSLFYVYNELGYLTSLTSSDKTVAHFPVYDRNGRLLLFDGIKRLLDTQGRTLSEIYPQGLSIHYAYDTRGRPSQISIGEDVVTYHYGAMDLQSVKYGAFEHVYSEYDLSGNLLGEELGGSMGSVHYSYDELSRYKTLRSAHFNQEVFQYDAVGNVQRMMRQNVSSAYTYDELYQLTSEITSETAHVYVMDALYNRLEKDGNSYSINALNQAVSHFTYDKNGNPIQSQEGHQYTYDALDRLVEIRTPETTQTFTYDFLNRCVSKTEGKTVYFLYDGQKEIGSFNENQKVEELRILGATSDAEIGGAVAMKLKGSLYVPIHDFQGSVAVLIPCDTGSLTSYTYTAFGEETIHGGAPNPWRFSSKRTDGKTHLVNFGRRWYLPAHGRWLTPDPEGFIDGMNLYAYVHNSPLTHWDAYGLLDEKGGGWDRMRSWGQSAWQHASQTYSQFTVGFNQAVANDQFNNAHFVNNWALKPLTRSLGYEGKFSGAAAEGWLSNTQQNLNNGFFSHANPNSFANKVGGFFGDTTSNVILFGGVTKCVKFLVQGGGKIAAGITAIRSNIISPVQKLIMNTRQLTFGGSLGGISSALPGQRAASAVLQESAQKYTKSNLQLGQQMHNAYKLGVPGLKEYRLPSGRKIDFLDPTNGIIYELKPNNPRAIRMGQKQLDLYLKEIKTVPRYKDTDWKTVLETY